MRHLAKVAILLFAPLFAVGQTQTCSTKSCLSFRALVAQRDAGILDKLASSMAYVCFYEKKDRFLIADYYVPYGDLYSSQEQVNDESTPRLFEANGTATVSVFDGTEAKPVFGVRLKGTWTMTGHRFQRDNGLRVTFDSIPAFTGARSVAGLEQSIVIDEPEFRSGRQWRGHGN